MLRQPCLDKLLWYSNNRIRLNTGATLQNYHRRTLPTLRKCPTFLVAQHRSRLLSTRNGPLSPPRRILTSPAVRRFGTTLSTETKSNTKRGRWWYVSNGIKILRIPFIVLSVYQMGYHQGLMDFSREPAKKKANILAGILQEMVRDERNEISSVTEGSQRVSQHRPQSSGGDHDDDPASSWRNARLARRVAAVGEKIVRTGREIVHQKVAEVAEPTLGGESDDNDGLEVDHEGLMDRIGICRETKDEIKWTFYLIDTSIPNAFVSELMPHSIFVTTAMMDLFIENDDELALVLGHEISHLILGHTSDMNRFQSRLAALEILLLSLDPTEGLFSIFCMACVAYIKKAIAASHSRDSERAADQLGIRIAAMSCFDTGRAATVFRKMALKKNQGETELKANVDQEQVAETTHFTDTHPPSMERYMNIKSMSKDENADKYRNTHCAEAKRSFMDAMRLYQYNRLRIKPVIQ